MPLILLPPISPDIIHIHYSGRTQNRLAQLLFFIIITDWLDDEVSPSAYPLRY